MDQGLGNAPKKLLIVEDDFYISDIYKTEAKRKGYIVYTAGDGEEALSLTKISRPDIILLDIMLPKVNGIDVLRTIRTWQGFSQIPVVFITNVGDSQTYQQAMQAGATDYLVKAQNTPEQIIDALQKYLQPTIPPPAGPPPTTPQ